MSEDWLDYIHSNDETFRIDSSDALNVIFWSSFFEVDPERFILAVKCVGSDLHLIRLFLNKMTL